jgi:phage host-nuclease inhibitor protein Gam
MARPRKTTREIESLAEAQDALRDLLGAEIELEKYASAADLARAAAASKYEADIDRAKARIADITLQLQNFYMGHTKELEKDGRKSVQLLYGVIGRRVTPPALKPLNRAWTWKAIGVALREAYRGRFFRQAEPEIDKDLVKAQLSEDELKAVGLKVEQEDKFYVETDRSTLEGANA